MTNLKGAIGTLCIVLFAGLAFGQKNYTQEADLIFQVNSYYAALDAYKKAYPKEKNNQEKSRILYRIGECYRLLQQPDQALMWYQKAEAAEYSNPELDVHSGDCYMKQGKYDEALAEYKSAIAANPMSSLKQEAERGIKACEQAVLKMKEPARYLVKNEVQLNTKYFDFSPQFADKKLQSLIFTSTRPAGGGSTLDPINGEGFSDIYITERDAKGKWSTPRPLEGINTAANEGAAVFDDKYGELYFTRCDYDEKKAFGCEIYQSRAQGQSFAEATKLDFGIDDTTVAAHPVFIDDDLILFVSDMRGGQGGKDLWYIRYEKKTKMWGPPVNLGPTINTQGDEMFPYIRENGELYFASNGHPGLGGLDIFKSAMLGTDVEEMKWGKPENLWAPINSPSNDFAIIYEGEKDRGYFSSDRPGGKGQDDIYNFMMPPLIFKLEGTVTVYDEEKNGKGAPLGNVKVKLLGTDGSVAETKTDATGKYEFETKENEERYILENTSYTIEVSAIDEPASDGEKYLGSKGQESTVGLKEPTIFIKDFALVCATCVGEIKMPLVMYDLGKAELQVNDSVNSKDSLDYLYKILIENPTITIELAAHTDTRGSDKANQVLSQRRAESCIKYLVEKGIDPARMTPVGYGETRPIISDAEISAMPTKLDQEAGHQKNRRTVFQVLSFDYLPPANEVQGTN